MNKIAIFGVPRSGTTWLSQIFNSHKGVALRFQPLFSYGHKGSLQPSASREDIDIFFSDIYHSNDDFALMQAKTFDAFPKFYKSANEAIAFKETKYINLAETLLENSDTKVIAIVRNPLSVLSSWINAPKEYSSDWILEDEWRFAPSKNSGNEDYYGFERWKEATELFHDLEKRFPEKFLIVEYQDLNSNTYSTTEKMFSFCELTIGEQTNEFISESKSRHDSDPYSVFKRKLCDDSYKEALPIELINTVKKELSGTPLEKYIYE